LFVALRDQGMTLLIYSHILAELEEYSTSMVILRQGKIIEHQALSSHDTPGLLVRIATTAPTPELNEVLAELPAAQWVAAQGDSHLIKVTGDKHVLNEVLTALIRKNIPVYSFAEEKLNMHDAYLEKVSAFDKSIAP
jgi:ABC-2 type transport system ATP-binding protein